MRFCVICVSAIFCAIFCACSATYELEGEDINLPQIGVVRTLSDVSAIAFEWDKIEDSRIQGVAIYRANPNGSEFSEIAHIKDANTTHFVDTALLPETEYYYFFRTLGFTHYSSQSPVIKAKTSFIDPVESVFASIDYPRQVKLIFSPHPNPSISHYLIQREVNGAFKTIALVNHRLLAEYFDSGLEDGTSYHYRVVAVDFNGAPSRPSKVVTARTKSIPKSPLNLVASNNLLNKVELRWSAPSGEIKAYNIFRAKSQNGQFKQIATSKNPSYIDEINAVGAEFYYQVTSIDETNLESMPSDIAQGRTKSAPQAPQIIANHATSKEAIISWSAVSGAKDYVLFRVEVKSGKQTRYKTSETIFVDKEVTLGDFNYSVIAISEDGLESAHSNRVFVTIK